MQPVQNVHWPGLLPPVQPQFWQPGQQPMMPPYPPGPVSLGSLSTGVPSGSVGSGTRSDNCDDEDDDQDQSQSSFWGRCGDKNLLTLLQGLLQLCAVHFFKPKIQEWA